MKSLKYIENWNSKLKLHDETLVQVGCAVEAKSKWAAGGGSPIPYSPLPIMRSDPSAHPFSKTPP